jgi:hypothetical protein
MKKIFTKRASFFAKGASLIVLLPGKAKKRNKICRKCSKNARNELKRKKIREK